MPCAWPLMDPLLYTSKYRVFSPIAIHFYSTSVLRICCCIKATSLLVSLSQVCLTICLYCKEKLQVDHFNELLSAILLTHFTWSERKSSNKKKRYGRLKQQRNNTSVRVKTADNGEGDLPMRPKPLLQ